MLWGNWIVYAIARPAYPSTDLSRVHLRSTRSAEEGGHSKRGDNHREREMELEREEKGDTGAVMEGSEEMDKEQDRDQEKKMHEQVKTVQTRNHDKINIEENEMIPRHKLYVAPPKGIRNEWVSVE